MKKLFFILVALIALGTIAQEIGRNQGFIFSVSEEGDSIYYSEDGSTNRVLPDSGGSGFASCRCYQGPDRATVNAAYWGSCCWVPPSLTNYPYCTHGCTTKGRI